MKKFSLIFLCGLVPILCFAQSRKRKPGTTISVTTSFNYYPSLEPYQFMSIRSASTEPIVLTFLTPRSGTFVIDDVIDTEVERTLTSSVPSHLFGVGASIQIEKEGSFFHEISLTKLAFNKSSHITEYIFSDTTGRETRIRRGYEQRSSAIALRYEAGKVFGDPKWSAVRFGLSGGIETSFYGYKRTAVSPQEYPIRARITTLEIALIPMLAIKLSKKLRLDVKVIPNMLLGDFGSIRERNPSIPNDEQLGEREYKSPDFNIGFSAMLRYTIKEPKRRGRR